MKTLPTTVKRIPLHLLTIDRAVQIRTTTHYPLVLEYSEMIAQGVKFPPITVFHRDGQPYYVADGFHRLKAHELACSPDISCEVRDGTKRDAILFAVGANAHHGLRRSSTDKRRAVIALLSDKEWGKWSDAEVARQCRVSTNLVRDVRSILHGPTKEEERRKYKRGGKVLEKKAKYSKSTPPPITPKSPLAGLALCPTCGQPIRHE